MASMSSAYSRPSSKPLQAKVRLMRSLTSKMEPKKLGVSIVAGCCLALLTYVSLAKLFAIYSPVFASTANTSAALMPPPSSSSSKPSVPETEAIPPQETETLLSGTDDGNSNDGDAAAMDNPVPDDLQAAAETAGAGSEDAAVEAAVAEKRKKERAAVLGEEPGMKPRMVIVSRAGEGTTRNKLVNLDAVAAAASELGFNVTAAEAEDVPAQVVNSADVLLAVHGAGLAADQIVFLPTKAVVMQIIVPPWGRTAAADMYGGKPELRDLQLRYLEYSVGEEETSATGWQDVSVDLTKFRPFLLQALDRLQE